VLMKMIPLSSSNEELIDEYETYKDDEMNAIRRWARKLTSTRKNVRELQQQYRNLLYQNLQVAYQVYIEATQSPYSNSLFEAVRSKLYTLDIKFNKNTSDAAILIRYISAEQVKAKTVYDWSSALILAESNNVPADQFADWLKSITITGAVKERKQLEKNDDDKKERMNRARRIILRALEARETKPLATIEKVVAHTFEREHVSSTGLVIALGTATRRHDRESFYADVNLSHILSPTIKFELLIIDHLAKQVVDSVEYYERNFDEMDERKWGDHVWERLVACEEEAEATQEK